MTHLCALAVLICLVPQQARVDDVGKGPKPSAIPVSWEIEFDFLDLKRIVVQLPGRQPEIYWYMVYTATNTSDRTQRFFPTLQLVTEDLHVHEPDMGISPLVFEQIRELHRERHPYLVHPTKAIGDLLTGDDNARESVAVWRQFDLTVNNFKVYVSGLSGETHFVRNPAYDSGRPEAITVTGPHGGDREVAVNPRYFTLRKTLEIRYTLPGSPEMRPAVQPERLGLRWIMR